MSKTFELDCSTLSRKIFNEDLKPPGSVEVNFEDAGLEGEDLFKELCMIFTEGMKILYGDENQRVNLDLLTSEQFEEIDKYFQSFGYHVSVVKKEADLPVEANGTLSHFRMSIKTRRGKYFINFWRLET